MSSVTTSHCQPRIFFVFISSLWFFFFRFQLSSDRSGPWNAECENVFAWKVVYFNSLLWWHSRGSWCRDSCADIHFRWRMCACWNISTRRYAQHSCTILSSFPFLRQFSTNGPPKMSSNILIAISRYVRRPLRRIVSHSRKSKMTRKWCVRFVRLTHSCKWYTHTQLPRNCGWNFSREEIKIQNMSASNRIWIS